MDAVVEPLVLAVLEPDRIALALGVLEQLENEAAALERQWKLRIERARYKAMRAQRQYNTYEPEDRLAARNHEHFWEERLRTVGKWRKSLRYDANNTTPS